MQSNHKDHSHAFEIISDLYAAALDPSLWDECLRKMSSLLSGSGGMILLEHGAAGIGKHEGKGANGSDLDVSLEILQHFQRAMQIRRRLTLYENQVKATLSMFDALDVGVVLLNGHGSLVHANLKAKEISALDLGLVMDADKGMVTAADPSQAQELENLIERAVKAGSNANASESGVLCLRMPGVTTCLSILAAPLFVKEGSSAAAGVILLVNRADSLKTIPMPVLKSLFGLTTSESEVVGYLIQGLSVEEIAEQRGIRACTARNQLKMIFTKMKVSRQSELIKLILSSPVGLMRFVGAEQNEIIKPADMMPTLVADRKSVLAS